MFLKRLLQLIPIIFTVLPVAVLAAEDVEKVSFSGTVETLACATACGVCCPSYSIVDTTGTLSLEVGNSFVDLAKISNDGEVHQISGFFYETSGQCGIGECTMFTVEEFDKKQISEPAYNAANGTINIQSVVINNIDNSRYKVILSAPFNVDSATEITAENLIPQAGDCSTETAICAEGTLCVAYSGPEGPEFKSCETPCSQPGALCPLGQSCVTIADGPGQVCRVN